MSKKIDMQEIMKYFFEEPNREFHIRELAKIIGIAPTTLSNYLEEFNKKGYLIRKRERGYILFSANSDNLFLKEMKKHYNIIKILESNVLNYLVEELNYPKAIILFGSYAKAENIKESDIDLFILSESKNQINMERFEKKLNAKIQLFIHTKKEFNIMKKENKELLNNIINGIKLYGFLEVF